MTKDAIATHTKTALVWCLMMAWIAYSGWMLWHLKERSSWVASICRTPQ